MRAVSRRLLVVLACLTILGVVGLLALPHLLPAILAAYRSDIRFAVRTEKKEIFLTIDDVPSQSTSGILRVLRKYGVPATFFVIADRVTSPAQLDEIVAAGHSLGNHLKTTKACSKLTQAQFQADFDTCSRALERLEKPRFFRPPSDFGTHEQIAYVESKGSQAVMGTVFPMDHWISDPDHLVMISSWLAVRGGIIILHDGAVRGLTTAKVLDRLIPRLQAAGYVFGRLEDGIDRTPKPVRPGGPG